MGRLQNRKTSKIKVTKRERKILKDRYFNPKQSSSYGGSTRVVKGLKNIVKKDKVLNWLSQTDTYTLHKPARKKFVRRKYIVNGPHALWQADLTDLPQLAKYNDGIRYILFAIDVFTRKAYGRPMKTKSGQEVTEAFKSILESEGTAPMSLQTDQGKEFLNSTFQALMKKYKINHYISYNQEIKAAFVERFQRTIKDKMFRYFTHKNSYRYLEVLEKFVNTYNNTIHSAIGVKPTDVNSENQELIWQRTYNKDEPYNAKNAKPKFAVGDTVRISKYSTTFKKGYLPSWSDEMFTIVKAHSTNPPVYSIADDSETVLKGTWYEKEMQKVNVTNNTFKIEEILGQRKVNGKIQYLVKWKGYPDSFNSYVDKRDIIADYKN